jgi:signal transduction histidine kinase/DNA-binding response OmpR family regulator
MAENLIFDNVATLIDHGIHLDDYNVIEKERNVGWSGKLWLGTHAGLVRIHTGSGDMAGMFGEDGLQIEPILNKFTIDPFTGALSIGAKQGMLSFGMEDLLENTFDPPAVLIDFREFPGSGYGPGSKIEKKTGNQNRRLDLPYNETILHIKFEAIKFPGSGQYQYKYFLKGIDKDTIITSISTYLTIYRDLMPGKYNFWANRINSNKIGNPDPITMDIIVQPPWYRARITIGIYVIVLIIAVSGFAWFRTIRLRKEKRTLELEVAKRTEEIVDKNRQIHEMEQLKTRFFTDVSHEIRTPLSLISGPLENLIERYYQDTDTNRWLKMIQRNSQRLLQLVNHLLDISKLDAGHMKLILEESDVLRHLNVLVQEYLSLAESRRIKLIVEIPKEGFIAFYDKEKVEKVTTNLLSNAFKYTPEHGAVTCRVKILEASGIGSDPQLRILVADTGPGIPVEERDKIFDRFYRAKGDQYEGTGGTGIGLALTRELIDLMKGDVVLKTLEGSGAVFAVTIPLGRTHLDESEYILKKTEEGHSIQSLKTGDNEEASSSGNYSGHQIKMLVTEDNEDLRIFIRENLCSEYIISEAEDGIRGWKKAQVEIPDIIITDLMMPGMDGIQLCRKLKYDARTSHIPVIMLTAKAKSQDKIEGLEGGADDYIFKPFRIDELKARIRNLLDQRERLKKKYSSMIGMDWGELHVTTLDEAFLKKTLSIVSDHLDDQEFNVGALREEMSISREHLFRKLKALTGESPQDLIRSMRLKVAASLIDKGEDSISGIALNVGFSTSSSFTRSFRKYYGKTPMQYRRSLTRHEAFNVDH